MKKLFKTVITVKILVTILTSSGLTRFSAQSRISTSITYQSFYDDLSPYGNWIEYPGYDHVWSPNLNEDFRPYLVSH